jgi:hypothetical protein
MKGRLSVNPPDHRYELAPPPAGVTDVLSQVVDGVAVAVTVGIGFTVTITVAVEEQPAVVPVTVYVDDAAGRNEPPSIGVFVPSVQV